MTEPVTETWTYMGRRTLKGGGLGDMFLDPNGEELLFKKNRGASAIGYAYEVPVDRSSDNSVRVGSPRYVGGTRHPSADAWATEDRAASVADTTRLREAKDARESRDLGTMTLEDIARTYRRLPAPQKLALEVQVLQRLRARGYE